MTLFYLATSCRRDEQVFFPHRVSVWEERPVRKESLRITPTRALCNCEVLGVYIGTRIILHWKARRKVVRKGEGKSLKSGRKWRMEFMSGLFLLRRRTFTVMVRKTDPPNLYICMHDASAEYRVPVWLFFHSMLQRFVAWIRV